MFPGFHYYSFSSKLWIYLKIFLVSSVLHFPRESELLALFYISPFCLSFYQQLFPLLTFIVFFIFFFVALAELSLASFFTNFLRLCFNFHFTFSQLFSSYFSSTCPSLFFFNMSALLSFLTMADSSDFNLSLIYLSIYILSTFFHLTFLSNCFPVFNFVSFLFLYNHFSCQLPPLFMGDQIILIQFLLLCIHVLTFNNLQLYLFLSYT